MTTKSTRPRPAPSRSKEMERLVRIVMDSTGSSKHKKAIKHRRAFTGRWLLGNEHEGPSNANCQLGDSDTREWSFAVTAQGRLVVYIRDRSDEYSPEMKVYESFSALAASRTVPEWIMAWVAYLVNEDDVMELAI